jgi:hypothetical protein
MSVDESAGRRNPAREARTPTDAPAPDPAELLEDLVARISELDAIAWNLPVPRDELLAPPDTAWPVMDEPGPDAGP